MESTAVNYEIRARTALERYQFSRPVKFALRDLIIKKDLSFFDFGCGKGSDVSFLKDLDISTSCYDPYFFPQNLKIKSDIVNIGYVINVIENPAERKAVIEEAFALANRCLIVAAQTKAAAISGAQVFGDGCVTKRETFQKYFSQEELKELLLNTLGVTPYPAGPGIFYVFKDENSRSEYLTVRYDSTRLLRSIGTATFKEKPLRVYRPAKEVNEEKLQKSSTANELINWVSTRGRFPSEFEFSAFDEFSKLGVTKIFLERWVLENVNQEAFENAQRVRKQDILIMLALTRFDKNGRPKLKDFPSQTKQDIKGFFGTYDNASSLADKLLFSVGNPENVQKAIQQSKIGKKLPNSIYFHTSAIPYISDVLQVFIGCGRAIVGDFEGDIIVKIPKKGNSISFLLYREFDDCPHPELILSIKANLKGAKVFTRDYSQSDNPPILHRKELFVAPDYPLKDKFIEETKKEEALGLLSRSDIGFKKNWEDLVSKIPNKEIPTERDGACDN